MVTRQISVVDIQEREDFDDLLRILGQHSAERVTVDIAADTDVLNTPGEFDELSEVARRHDVELELASEDPIRQELGRIYGMTVVTGPSWDTTAILGSRGGPDARTIRFERPSFDPSADQRIVDDSEVEETAQMLLAPLNQSPFASDASFSFVVAPPDIDYRPRPANRPNRRARRAAERSLSTSLGSSSIVVSALVIAGAIAVLLTALLAPAAEVAIVPETRSLNAEITYGLAGAGQPLDVEIAPAVLTRTLTYEATVPASGEMLIPDEPARGMVFLTNPFAEVVTLPEGTLFTPEGAMVSYQTVEAIQIPAADPFESARFGTAAVGIRAVEPGPAGNLDVGVLSGVHESGIIFQNRFPVDGGTERSVTVVTEGDLQLLNEQARMELEAQIPTSLDAEVEPGWAFADGPRAAGEMVTSFSAAPGDAAEEVTVTAELNVEAATYDPEALELAARDHLLQSLAVQVPAGFGLTMDSIRLSVPQAIESGGTAFRVSAEGTAEAIFDADSIDTLKNDLVGHGEGHAERVLASVHGVESFSTSYGPSWLPWNPVPRLSDRVSIEIDGS